VRDILLILKKEWRNFTGSEKGVFVVYGVLIFFWSFLPLSYYLPHSGAEAFKNQSVLGGFAFNGAVWWLFFSVIVSSSFASSVFIAERMSGSMEILLTSGFSRNSVLFGKVLFVFIICVVIGCCCFGLSSVWIAIASRFYVFSARLIVVSALLYCAGSFMNSTIAAWMSIRLSSPRLVPFANLLISSIIFGMYSILDKMFDASIWILVLLLVTAGIVFFVLAQKDFHSEKIIAPVDV
jgi:ABC-type transport system involved in multi-copper enzyme maturation permease subunit